MIPPLLTGSVLTRRYGRRAVVEDFDIALYAGRITALLGASGSGKSTLLRLLAGLETVDSGQIRSGDTLLSGPGRTTPPEHRDIGLMFQEHALFPHRTVLGNVVFGLNHLPRAEARDQALALLRALKLDHRADAWPSALSGGEQQRVALARALARKPGVLLMDEPFSGLDAALRAEVRQSLMPALRASGAAILIVTHDADDALSLADEVVLMDAGRRVQSGPPETVYRQPTSALAARMLGPVIALPARPGPDAIHTPLGTFARECATTPDSVVRLLVRPHDLRLDTGKEDGALSATVSAVQFSGAHVTVTVQLDRADQPEPLVLAHTGPAPATGQAVSLYLSPDRAVFVAD